ncbi:hypothetical protein TCAL_13287 [Tigriopus californicus]|uniref:Chorion peroxidase n=1 Tax=Tigriopus californicus TaxID=6832 RepID=A0A553NUG3_TIGCA|nr:hypothetical protein TCAL_13287 [Tigriopus californicus]|eukprot:TCALIF_13287-PA protein Name:"Similar to Pxt Chorion peroxidase (Drosophila melanogaster)" AED:0.04 eAED:0.04 QI:333/0.75/0.8/1/0.5/0.4/5/243/702
MKSHHLIVRALLLLLLVAIHCFGQRCFRKTPSSGSLARCDSNARYRTFDGRCNNLANPDWGSAGEPLRRFLPNAYEDGRGIPRGGGHPSSLPSPRWVSQKNHPDSDVPDSRFTHMVMQFGQFLDHDLTLAPKDEQTDCCKSEVREADCFTIAIPSPDRFFSWVNNSATCLNLIRSTPVCGSRIREQYNELTAYIDASNIYGSDEKHAKVLRTFKDGRLHRNSNTDQLPTRDQLGLNANSRLLRPEKPGDFMAGDMRVNEHPFLATLHVDEILYQETRKLIGAEMQNIVYGEFLPTVLGVDFMRRYDLIVKEETEYDANVDATIFNSFASAAFRFGHSMINGMFKLVSQRQSSTKSEDVYWLWRLREVFDGQSIRGARLPLENMLEGLITQEPQTCDAFFTTEITDHLFQKNNLRENFGLDLLALNIQRAREHGVPSYSSYRRKCGLRPLKNWNERPTELDEDYWKSLQDVYNSVEDIDLYVGAIAEKNVQGGVVGPTFACLIGEQFSRLKRGDRFFYTHSRSSGGQGLGPVTKKAILQRTLGDIMCDVSQLGKAQKWVTLQPNSDYNNVESCNTKFRINMREVAQEIAQELKSVTIGNREVRTLVRGNPPSNQFLHRGRPIQFQEVDAVTRPLSQEFPARAKTVLPTHPRVPTNLRLPSKTIVTEPRSEGSPTRSTQVLINRLSNNSRVGVSTTACIFQLCS